MVKIRVKVFLILSSIALGVMLFFLFLARERPPQTIVIGAKNCVEQHLLSEMLSLLVEKHTDLRVKRSFNLEGTLLCFTALKNGTIDLYCEYTGTALLEILKGTSSSENIYRGVKDAFLERWGLVWLQPLGFNNTYALIVRAEEDLDKISDLESVIGRRFALEPELASRSEYQQLKNRYPRSALENHQLMDQTLLYVSLLNHQVDLISGFSTDAPLASLSLKMLVDDRNAFPAYEVAPVVRKEILEQYPDLEAVLNLLAGVLDEATMQRLNAAVVKGERAHTVALQFLQEIGLFSRK